MAVEARRVTSGDIAAIRGIDTAAGRPPADAGALAAAIVDENRLVVVASADGALAGWGKTHFWSFPDRQAPSGR